LDLKYIRSIIDLMKKNDLSEFALEQQDFKIKLRRGYHKEPIVGQMVRPDWPSADPAHPASSQTVSGTQTNPSTPPPAPSGTEVTSPMVGTFYRSPSPDAPPFVEVGSEVQEDTVICIIEAMKQFNEIRAEKKGIVTAVLADNGKPVDYGQPLFLLQ